VNSGRDVLLGESIAAKSPADSPMLQRNINGCIEMRQS